MMARMISSKNSEIYTSKTTFGFAEGKLESGGTWHSCQKAYFSALGTKPTVFLLHLSDLSNSSIANHCFFSCD